jgi:hypothetical protein
MMVMMMMVVQTLSPPETVAQRYRMQVGRWQSHASLARR